MSIPVEKNPIVPKSNFVTKKQENAIVKPENVFIIIRKKIKMRYDNEIHNNIQEGTVSVLEDSTIRKHRTSFLSGA